MQRRVALIAAVAVAGAAAWYAFRPERLFIDKTVNESLAAEVPAARAAAPAAPMALATGAFHGVHHATMGQATIYRLPNGKRVLRFTGFETSNGPDVQIYLVATSDAQDNATVTTAGFVNLGPMKGNRGDQNYDVPDGVDLSKYRAVTVWCRRFGVNFATAPLSAS
jgi:Electron transfer DM13